MSAVIVVSNVKMLSLFTSCPKFCASTKLNASAQHPSIADLLAVTPARYQRRFIELASGFQIGQRQHLSPDIPLIKKQFSERNRH